MILYLLIFLLSICSTLNQIKIVNDPLLRMSDNTQCIKQVIDEFIKKETCQKLSESQKAILAIKITNCLNAKLGKQQIPQCKNFKQCKIQGDDWNSFTTFFTHIDNLCHFYWDLMYHERTEQLIDNLSHSAILAQDILKENHKSTQQILQTQQIIQQFMQKSLTSNQKLSETLKNSQSKLQNMTQNIQQFLDNLNQKLLFQYSSIVKAMETINNGIDGINTVQGFMISEIHSISGILYFLLQILIIVVVTSFKSFRKNRMHFFILFGLNIVFQLLAPDFIIIFIGVRAIRILFVLIHILNFVKSFARRENNFEQIKNYMDNRLDTRRIKRIFKEIMQQEKIEKYQN